MSSSKEFETATMEDLFGSDSDGEAQNKRPNPSSNRRAHDSDDAQESDTAKNANDEPNTTDIHRGRSPSRSPPASLRSSSRSQSRSPSRSPPRSTGSQSDSERKVIVAPESADEEQRSSGGGESEVERVRKSIKKRRRVREEEEEERGRSSGIEGGAGAGAEDDVEADLFGGASSDEEGGSDRAQIPPRRPPKPESKLDMSVPKIPRFIHEGQEVYLVRPPNFMGLEHKPFDPKTFSEEEEALRREQEGATHVSVENTIRWRSVVDEHGQERKESNARLVRWSDNTVSLMLGNEFFDANTTEGSQHQYLTVQFPQEGIFQTQARMPKTMMFRPYGVNQLVHRKLTREIAIKHEKKIKTKQIVTMMDPEKQREALERAEMEKMRARRRLESKRRNTALSRGLTARGLEDDSEDEAMYLRGNEGIRRAFDGYDDDFVVNDEEDDEDEEERREAERRDRIMRAKQAPETPRNANPSQGSSSSSHLPPKADPASRADRRPPRPSKRVGDDAMDVDRDDVGVSRSKKKRHIISSDEDD